jgi:hypothetical protein
MVPSVVSSLVRSSFAFGITVSSILRHLARASLRSLRPHRERKSISPSSLISVSRVRLLIVGQGRLSEANGAERLWRCCGD